MRSSVATGVPGLGVVVVLVVVFLAGAASASASVSVQYAGLFGWDVNETKTLAGLGSFTQAEMDLCTVSEVNSVSKPVVCKMGKESKETGGFFFPEGVAAGPAPSDYVYVADKINRRVQVFSATGAFVDMFGWHVNKTKVIEVGVKTPTAAEVEEEDVCPRSGHPGDECQAGQAEPNGVAGTIVKPVSITVDQSTGNIFVFDLPSAHRVEEYEPNGKFVLMIGWEVNETKAAAVKLVASPTESEYEEEDTCTAAEKCKIGEESATGNSVATTPIHGAFKSPITYGNLLAVDANPAKPAERLLYVGDEGWVQEFNTTTGRWVGELALTPTSTPAFPTKGLVNALAVDGTGDLYVTESHTVVANEKENTPVGVYEFDKTGKHVAMAAPELEKAANVKGLTLEPGVELIVATEQGPPISTCSAHVSPCPPPFGGVIYEATGKLLNTFELPGPPESPQAAPVTSVGMNGVTFMSSTNSVYVSDPNNQSIDMYKQIAVANLTNLPCTNMTASGFTLHGDVGPSLVPKTEAWFEYGPTEGLGGKTPKVPIQTGVTLSFKEAIEAAVEGLIPNQIYHFRLAAEDENQHAPASPLHGTESTCPTLPVPPVIEKTEAQFVGPEAGDLFGQVNPENARTAYHFEYVTQQDFEATGWANAVSMPVSESAVYGAVGLTEETAGLKPSTTYAARMTAKNVYGEPAEKALTFTTLPPVIVMALIGSHSVPTATTATISGSVNPGGQPAVYRFELAVDKGANIEYHTVFSGLTGTETAFELEQHELTDLQPNTTYAYRITIESGYGKATSATETFTTETLPQSMPPQSAIQQLPTPPYGHPKQPPPPPKPCKHGLKRNGHGKCVKVKKKPKGHGNSTGRRKRSHRGRKG